MPSEPNPSKLIERINAAEVLKGVGHPTGLSSGGFFQHLNAIKQSPVNTWKLLTDLLQQNNWVVNLWVKSLRQSAIFVNPKEVALAGDPLSLSGLKAGVSRGKS